MAILVFGGTFMKKTRIAFSNRELEKKPLMQLAGLILKGQGLVPFMRIPQGH
jgi:hypothetical protein